MCGVKCIKEVKTVTTASSTACCIRCRIRYTQRDEEDYLEEEEDYPYFGVVSGSNLISF